MLHVPRVTVVFVRSCLFMLCAFFSQFMSFNTKSTMEYLLTQLLHYQIWFYCVNIIQALHKYSILEKEFQINHSIILNNLALSGMHLAILTNKKFRLGSDLNWKRFSASMSSGIPPCIEVVLYCALLIRMHYYFTYLLFVHYDMHYCL